MPHGDTQIENVDVMLKSGQAFKYFSPFIQSKAYKEGEGDDEKLYIETLASSDQEDLVGDVMSLDALSQMEATAVGILMFRDHDHSVEKIFGQIVEAKLIEQDGKTYLWIKACVNTEDEANLRIFKNIAKGFRLGASVTVLITKTGTTPGKRKGIYITGVKLLEISIVGIPCNQDAHTIAATASKALQRRIQAIARGEIEVEVDKAMEIKEKAEEVEAAEQTTVEEAAPDTAELTEPETEAGEGEDPAEAVELSYFPLAEAAQKLYADLRAGVEAGTVEKDAQLPATASKAMFADLKEHPKFWDLIDILWACYWHCDYMTWLVAYNGDTDFSDVQAEWAEILQEFAAAQIDSFDFWKIPSEDAEKTLSIEEAQQAAEYMKNLAAIITAMPDKADQFRAIGEEVLKSAIEAGIQLPNVPAVKVDVSLKDVPQMQAAIEKATTDLDAANETIANLEKELGDAQKALSDTEAELEAAKAGIQANTEAMKRLARQPLGVGRNA